MPKEPIEISFVHGMDTKTDPKQVMNGHFLSLQNTIFTTTGLIRKRNGYTPLPTLPSPSSYLTTFGGNLTAIGSKLEAFSNGNQNWINKGAFQPLSLTTTPVVRSALNCTQSDSVTSSNGLVCTVYSEMNNSTATFSYVIQDFTTGQNIIPPTPIPVPAGTVTRFGRVFLLGGYFIIVFTTTVLATEHLQYIAVSLNSPTTVTVAADIAPSYDSTGGGSWDGVVVGDRLFIAYNTSAGGQQIEVSWLNTALQLSATVAFIGSGAALMSMCADISRPSAPVIYAAYFNGSNSNGYVFAIDKNLNKLMLETQIFSSVAGCNNITCAAQNGSVEILYEVNNPYSYDSTIDSNFLRKVNVVLPNTVTTGTVGSTTTFVRSVGLASKAFLFNGLVYVLTAYDGSGLSTAAIQPTYFLVDINGNIIAKVAYENGGGYVLGLPTAQVMGSTMYCSYLFKDLVLSVNKTQGAKNSAGVYSQAGINLGAFTFGPSTLTTSELGKNLNLTGGYLYAYDGNTITEQNFHLFPDSIEATWSASGGSVVAKPDGTTNTNAYFFQVIYQWTDNQGNIMNSAPSIPVPVTTTGSGSSGSIVINGPTARLTNKKGVKILIFRWSVAQQLYYQVTSIGSPLLNDPTVDSWTFTDTLADASILGNSLIYTTGGIVENVGAPSFNALTIFDTRLWGIDAEDPNLLWYSKQVIEATPVEMSDLFTKFIAANAGTNQSVGTVKCIFPMDDKLIIFLHSPSGSQAIYYINGTGPDNTGVNSQYSEPIFITTTVSCTNQASIVLVPAGIMFQSADGKGIWLLDRNLQTSYIGDRMEQYNGFTVNSAENIPGTTYVIFTLTNSNGVNLMYDYYYNEWGTFTGLPAVHSTIYQKNHTLINSAGNISQQNPTSFIDNGGNPVLMQFTTGWIKYAGLQGYQRVYSFYFIGQYYSPHKLDVGLSYDYMPWPTQQSVITPPNFSPNFGNQGIFGDGTPFGGPAFPEEEKIHFKRQKCTAFQIAIQELYDPSLGVPAGAGFTMSGLNIQGMPKRTSRPIRAAQTTG